MIRTAGRYIATKPFPTQHITGTVRGGLALMDQKISLSRLEVVFDSDSSNSVRAVYVRADQYAQPWAKQIYSLEDAAFILVPTDSVVLTETSEGTE